MFRHGGHAKKADKGCSQPRNRDGNDMTGLGVGRIGTGYMGKCHALAWNAVTPVFGDVERPRLVGLAGVDMCRARAMAAELGFALGPGEWRRLISDPAIVVISITTPN